jgi:hypothetical protein
MEKGAKSAGLQPSTIFTSIHRKSKENKLYYMQSAISNGK